MSAYTLPWRKLEGNLLPEGSGLRNDFISMVLYTSNLAPREEERGVNLAPMVIPCSTFILEVLQQTPITSILHVTAYSNFFIWLAPINAHV